MGKITGNELAYPLGIDYPKDGETRLTIRQHFAAMAMEGFCANNSMYGCTFEETAQSAVRQADALIEALNNSQDK